ncbi:MAG: N-acetylmuramoyl-L-alanine amidase [Tissierellia bacterium]|nr:N-acetylmuramoyl-L-alanine amidase [Tissierellia bacterium]
MIGKIKEYLAKLNKQLLIVLSIVILLLIIKLPNYKVLSIFNSINENTIVVDPGHGGIDGGAGKKNDILEKDINLQVSAKLKKELIVEGFQVIMTREEDVSLENFSNIKGSRYRRDLDARKTIINNNKPLAFISIHCNSSKKTSAKGIKVYYYPESIEGEKLAKSISQSIDENFYKAYMKEENLRTEILTEDFFILRETDYPGVLIEVGFLTNPEENKLLREDEYQRQIARAIKKGILKYLE